MLSFFWIIWSLIGNICICLFSIVTIFFRSNSAYASLNAAKTSPTDRLEESFTIYLGSFILLLLLSSIFKCLLKFFTKYFLGIILIGYRWLADGALNDSTHTFISWNSKRWKCSEKVLRITEVELFAILQTLGLYLKHSSSIGLFRRWSRGFWFVLLLLRIYVYV